MYIIYIYIYMQPYLEGDAAEHGVEEGETRLVVWGGAGI
jgi:hypothetical protein